MHDAPDSATGATPPWRSFHHVALATPDLDATLAFYGMVLSMEAGEIMTRGGIRHCMVKPGDGEAWGLHFFEDPRAQLFTDREEMRALFADPNARFGSIPGALQHIAFSLPHETAALALRERLRLHDVPMTDVFEVATIRDFLFADNNGMLLEAAWPRL